MGRSISEIENSIISEKENNRKSLETLTSTSNASIWRMFVNTIAIVQFQLEVLVDVWKEELTDRAYSAIAANERWFSFMITDYFQYDAGSPQILTFDTETFEFFYPIVDESLRIVTKASSSVDEASNLITIKVAKGDSGSLEILDSNELSALTTYVNQIKQMNQRTQVLSLAGDRLFIDGQIYIDGQFVSQVVMDDVKSAINDYLAGISFDSIIYYQKVESAILGVDGVIDLKTDSIQLRAAADSPFGFGAYKNVEPSTTLYSGFAILEDESQFNLDNNLEIIVQ